MKVERDLQNFYVFLEKKKKAFIIKTMTEIISDDGICMSDQKKILSELTKFYKKKLLVFPQTHKQI